MNISNIKFSMLTLAISVSLISPAYASSISASFESLKLPVSYLEESVTLSPAGPGLSLSYDVNDNWSVDVSFQSWQDDAIAQQSFSVDTDLDSQSVGVSYYDNSWSYSVFYSRSEDDTVVASVNQPDLLNRKDNSESSSLGLSVGYGWMSGDWFYNASVGLQQSDWDSQSIITVPRQVPPPNDDGSGGGGNNGGGQGGGGNGGGQGGGGNGGGNNGGGNNGGGQDDGNPPPPQVVAETGEELNNGDASSISASFSLARFWQLDDSRGVLTGAMLSWNHTFSGESALVSQTGRIFNGPNNRRGGQSISTGGNSNFDRAAGTGVGSFTGDDSYGQLGFYLSYDITESVSIDFDTGFDLGTDNNEQVWSVSIGYYF